MSKKDDLDITEHMASRCDQKYQNEWRALVHRERDLALKIKQKDNMFGSLLEIWCNLTESILNLAYEKYKGTKINATGSKNN